MQKSRKVNTEEGEEASQGFCRLVPDPSPGGGDRPEQSHWVCAPEVTPGKPNVRTFGTTPQLQQLTGCWSKGWSRRRWRAPTCIGFSTNCWSRGPGQRPAVALRSGPQVRHAGLPVDSFACCGESARDHRPGSDPPLSTLGAERSMRDQMNVHPSCGQSSDGDGDRAGDCRRRTGGSPARQRCKKSSQEFVEHLSGNEEHLFNLKADCNETLRRARGNASRDRI